MAIPQALYSRAVIPTTEADIKKLQRIKNRVWRYLLGIGGYSTVEDLRGEIGASSDRSRIMENMLAYILFNIYSAHKVHNTYEIHKT